MRFATASHLVHELIEARDEKRLLRLQAQLARVNLLIVDELGYVPLSQTGSELLFDVFSRTLRERRHHRDLKPALPGMDDGLRQRAPHRRAARPHHPPCPYPGDERRELPAQAEPVTTPATVRITPPLARVGPHAPLTRGPPPAARRARRPARGALPWTTRTSYHRARGTFLRLPPRYIFPPSWGKGEDHMPVVDIEQIGALPLDPAGLRQGLTPGAVTVPARRVLDRHRPAVVAMRLEPAKRGGAAVYQRIHDPLLLDRGPVRLR